MSSCAVGVPCPPCPEPTILDVGLALANLSRHLGKRKEKGERGKEKSEERRGKREERRENWAKATVTVGVTGH